MHLPNANLHVSRVIRLIGGRFRAAEAKVKEALDYLMNLKIKACCIINSQFGTDCVSGHDTLIQLNDSCRLHKSTYS
jgi:hypothetical protein